MRANTDRARMIPYKRAVLLLVFLNYLISCYSSRQFFIPIREGAGSENFAYKYFNTGLTLPDDKISVFVCKTYAYITAFLIIMIFWNWVFYLFWNWKWGKLKLRYVSIVLVLGISGAVMLLSAYPHTVVEATDTTWNYVYAKEFLPVYWHGFLTNVFHCACMIVLPHPAAMSLIPYILGVGEISYLAYMLFVKTELGKGWTFLLSVSACVFLILTPETIPVFMYSGRNYNFALLSIGYVGILLTDFVHKHRLSCKKFFVLLGYVLILSNWRGEGIFYLISFPIMLIFAYSENGSNLMQTKNKMRKIVIGGGYRTDWIHSAVFA